MCNHLRQPSREALERLAALPSLSVAWHVIEGNPHHFNLERVKCMPLNFRSFGALHWFYIKSWIIPCKMTVETEFFIIIHGEGGVIIGGAPGCAMSRQLQNVRQTIFSMEYNLFFVFN